LFKEITSLAGGGVGSGRMQGRTIKITSLMMNEAAERNILSLTIRTKIN